MQKTEAAKILGVSELATKERVLSAYERIVRENAQRLSDWQARIKEAERPTDPIHWKRHDLIERYEEDRKRITAEEKKLREARDVMLE
jgi:hypothetical protein